MTQSQQNNNIDEEYDLSLLDEINHKEYNFGEVMKEFMFYLFPIFSFIFFLLILFFAVIPSVGNINSKINDIDNLRGEETRLNDRITKIRQLDQDAVKNQDVMNKINEIVPTGQTEVVKFGERIKAALTKNILENLGIKSGESILVDPTNNQTTSTTTTSSSQTLVKGENVLSLREIPSEFDIKGGYEDIRNFFIQLYQGTDFFVVDEMSLNKNSENIWSGAVSLAKYQFSQSPVFDPKIAYGYISESLTPNQVVIKFLQTKFINNVFENNIPTITPTVIPTITPTTAKP